MGGMAGLDRSARWRASGGGSGDPSGHVRATKHEARAAGLTTLSDDEHSTLGAALAGIPQIWGRSRAVVDTGVRLDLAQADRAVSPHA